ncbi:response regulator [Cellulomonas fimi]|uniref:response regulator n=1 Tax=Cellulomonas fimi TaxID=1708 RepID=UPI00235A4408|nr:response regulator [Cellulomonas fimi]
MTDDDTTTRPARARTTARVLVVDDEPDERALLATHLRRAGCEVVEAPSAEAALADESQLDVDVAFVDLRLPGMGGWELVEELRRRRPGLPVVVTSVLDEHDYPDVEAALPKPFVGEHVRAALERALPDGSP